ncbi:AAA family ATPase [Kribbella sp. NBC_01484]|uniref:dynamin family protein n=1 Tax=Kribbella sp. NBC_01484 TaxID=2903579 RepID=UPI002E3789CF|nr:dynamin family protein [Kribbella sp. NBC_01484]
MADIRSAAGEGSEPRVPNQDQPARELANLIAQSSAQSDAKGKGFWRRRRRKSATPPEPPSTPDSTATPTAADPTTDYAVKQSESAAKASTPEAEKPASDETPAAATDKPAPDPADNQSSEAADSAGSEAAKEQQPKAADEPAPDAADATPAEADAALVANSAENSRAEPAPPTVGVIYEPDESPDGFPLEYGNMIVGLPKPEKSDDSTEATPETPATNAAETSPRQSAEGADEQSSNEPAGDGPAADSDGSSSELSTEDTPAAEQAPKSEQLAEESSESAPNAETDADAGEKSTGISAEAPGAGDGVAAAGDAADAVAVASNEAADPAAEDGSEADAADAQGSDVAGGAAQAEGAKSAPKKNKKRAAAAAAAAAAETGAAAEKVPSGTTADASAAGGRAADEAVAPGAEDSSDAVAGGSSEAVGAAAEGSGGAGDAAAEDAGEGSGDEQAEGSPAGRAEADETAPERDSQSSSAGEDAEGASEVDAAAVGAAAAERGQAEADDSVEESEEPAAEDAAADAPGDSSDEPAAEQDDAAQGDATHDDGEQKDAGQDAAAQGDAGQGDAAQSDAGQEAAQEAEEVRELTAEELAERLAAEQAAMALITALMKLRGALAGSQLPLDVVGADEARQQQKAMLDQLDDYLLPRLVQLEAPVLAVVGGSTGAGKSTLVNTVIGKVVSEPGVLRPTTRSPVLIHHPADADWFVGDRVLPGMARTSSESPGGTEEAGQLRLVAADTVPQGLAILDAPDIDSVVEANRDLATQLLAAADLWLFVTTAARYSDAVPWDFLQSASDRSTAIAVVLDRAPGETIDDITGHLAQMLLERGLGDSPLFSIEETVVDGNGMLPAETVASIKDWLIDLAADAEARAAVVRRTLQGAVSAMVKTTPPFAAAVRAQADTAIELRSTAESAYDQAVKDIAKATQDGTLLRGEVLARWQEFVGTGELLKGLQTNVGRMRDKVKKSLVNQPAQTRDVSDAIESGLESLLREQAAAAAERAEKAWQASAAGRQLLAAGGPEIGALSEDFPAAAGRTVREWQAYVLDLVRKEGADKRSTARILEYGVNGLGLSLMVVIFASGTGIPKAAEASAGAGSAVVGQKLLEAVFGDTSVRTLVDKAREDLDGKVHALMDAEFARYLAVLDQHPVDPETARQLTEAARAVEDCT